MSEDTLDDMARHAFASESKRVFVSKTEIQNMYNERMKKLVEAGEDKFQQAQELANWLNKRKGNKFTKPKKKRVRKSDGR